MATVLTELTVLGGGTQVNTYRDSQVMQVFIVVCCCINVLNVVYSTDMGQLALVEV